MNPIERLLSVFAPHVCVGCGAEGSVLSDECADTIARLPSICYVCGRAAQQYRPCQKCISANSPQHLWMAFAYDDLPKAVLHSYKFNEQRAAAKRIADFIDETLPFFTESPVISFVPTATAHRRARGFDHAEHIAKYLASKRRWRYVRLLQRTAQTRQLGATREQRRKQLKGLYRPINEHLIKGSHILLIDDVVTTGATIEECVKTLRKAGAHYIDAAVFARTMEKK